MKSSFVSRGDMRGKRGPEPSRKEKIASGGKTEKEKSRRFRRLQPLFKKKGKGTSSGGLGAKILEENLKKLSQEKKSNLEMRYMGRPRGVRRNPEGEERH